MVASVEELEFNASNVSFESWTEVGFPVIVRLLRGNPERLARDECSLGSRTCLNFGKAIQAPEPSE